MSQFLIVITGLIYLGVAIDQYFKGGIGQAVMFFGYAIGNVGIYLTAK